MVLIMDINKQMYIWVDTIFRENVDGSGIVVDGNAYGDELGFGMDKRDYTGQFIQISQEGKTNDYGKIDMIHFSRFGLKWNVDSKIPFSKIPFLMTSNLEVNHIFSGEIYLKPSTNAQSVFEKFSNRNFPIVSKKCIGNLNIKESKFYIDVFSDSKIDKSDILNEAFCFAGYDDIIGILKFIG